MNHAFLLLSLALAASLPGVAAESFVQNSEHRLRIEQAVPAKGIFPPAKPRRLLIFTLNVGYGGHPSIAYANEAFTVMGQKTGAFETMVSADPAVFQRSTLKQFDAVFFNNNVGNCFTNAELRQNLIEFVVGGGGLLGVHGTTVAFTQWPGAVEDWPEFGFLIGARGANHKDSDEHVWLKLDDAENPITQVFGGQGFDYRDEFFRPQGSYSRSRVRVLLSIDTTKTDPSKGQPRGNCFREDNDYAVAWIRNYGRGRVFYSTIAHNPYVFWDAKMLQFYLAALQFALGDLPAPTTPSARLTPAMRVQEKLGWRLALESRSFPNLTFFETIDRAARLGLPYIGGSSAQTVGKDLAKSFGPELSDAELTAIRLKLESAGLRLLTYDLRELPNDEAACRRLFEFGRKLGIETFIAEPQPETLDRLEKLCNEYAINLALRNADRGSAAPYWKPEALLKACKNRSRQIGACCDVGAWLRSGVDPVRAVRTLNDRVLTVQVHDLDAASSRGQEVPWGTGRGQSAKLLTEIEQLGLKPAFGLDYPGPAGDLGLKLTQCVEFFNQTSEKLGAKPK